MQFLTGQQFPHHGSAPAKESVIFAGHRTQCFPGTEVGDTGSEFGGRRGSGHLEVNKCPMWAETWKKTQDVPDSVRSLNYTLSQPFHGPSVSF